MRIAQVAPLAESVPPKLYGGTERVVSWLTEELVALGHDVTLFASADSITSAELVPICPQALRLGKIQIDAFAPYAVMLDCLNEMASGFDVIHCHLDWLHLPLLRPLEVPSVTTLHGRLDLPYLTRIAARFPGMPFVSISDSQRAPLPDLNWLATVHHGMPVHTLKSRFEPGNYLAFLGRIVPEKGPETALRVARAAKQPLRIAAKVERTDEAYFEERIQPLLTSGGGEFVGELDDRAKASFLSEAAALLFLIDWPEPFGLVMIEAMACGTPVIAMRRGSVAEIIDDGVSGFVVDTEDEAIAALARLSTLDRRRVRAAFEWRFTSRHMANEYVRLYRELTGEKDAIRRDALPAAAASANPAADGRTMADFIGTTAGQLHLNSSISPAHQPISEQAFDNRRS